MIEEAFVAELNLESKCSLTLTTKHLRGQFWKMVRDNSSSKRTVKDQIDVLLNGIAGYSIEHIDKTAKRISWICGGVILFLMFLFEGVNDSSFGAAFFGGLFIGGMIGWLGWKFNPDKYAFAINVMGAQSLIPIKVPDLPVVKEFMTKLQNAKIAYDEANG